MKKTILALFVFLFLFSDVYDYTVYANPVPDSSCEPTVPERLSIAAWNELNNEVFLAVLRESQNDEKWEGKPKVILPAKLPEEDLIFEIALVDNKFVIFRVIPEMRAALMTSCGYVPPEKVQQIYDRGTAWSDPARESIRLFSDGDWSTCWILEMSDGLTARQLAQILQDIWKCHEFIQQIATEP